MNGKTVGFIGGGRVARILLGGWAKAGKLPAEIVVSDADELRLARLKEWFDPIRIVPQGNAQAAGQDIVFLAVHPPAVSAALAEVKPAIRPDAIVVSLAPKLPIEKLSALLGGFGRVARTIPNAASIVGAGFNPIAFGDGLPGPDREILTDLFAALGDCPVVAENKLEAYAVVTAMGPTYFWPQFYELLALGESFGLSRTEAAEGIRQMVAGAVATMFDSGLDGEAVQDLIPVKPLGEIEPTIREAYRAKLTAVMDKIRP